MRPSAIFTQNAYPSGRPIRRLHEVLRRPVEFAKYTSVRLTEIVAFKGLTASIGSAGDYGNAATETVMGLFKNEAIAKKSIPIGGSRIS